MVKIEIDDAVRSYALVYSQRVMATCADVEKKTGGTWDIRC